MLKDQVRDAARHPSAVRARRLRAESSRRPLAPSTRDDTPRAAAAMASRERALGRDGVWVAPDAIDATRRRRRENERSPHTGGPEDGRQVRSRAQVACTRV